MRDLAIIFRERLEHGIKGIDLNFEFKMASSTKCCTYSGCVMDVVFLISLTHKLFHQPSSSPFLPLSCIWSLLLCVGLLPSPSTARQICNENFEFTMYWLFRV